MDIKYTFHLFTSIIGLVVDLGGIYGYLSFLRIPNGQNTHSLPINLLLIIFLFYFLGIIGYILISKYLRKTQKPFSQKSDNMILINLGYSFFSWLPFSTLWFYNFSQNTSEENFLGLFAFYIFGLLVGWLSNGTTNRLKNYFKTPILTLD